MVPCATPSPSPSPSSSPSPNPSTYRSTPTSCQQQQQQQQKNNNKNRNNNMNRQCICLLSMLGLLVIHLVQITQSHRSYLRSFQQIGGNIQSRQGGEGCIQTTKEASEMATDRTTVAWQNSTTDDHKNKPDDQEKEKEEEEEQQQQKEKEEEEEEEEEEAVGRDFDKVMKNILENVKIRYYVYDDPEMNPPTQGIAPDDETKRDEEKRDGEIDYHTVETLKAHPLRTRDPREADLFVIPLLIAAVDEAYNTSMRAQIYQKAFDKLGASPWFQKYQGHRHVIVSTHWSRYEMRMYKENWRKITTGSWDTMIHHYPLLWNVTLAGSKDKAAIWKMFQDQSHPDFQKWFEHERFQLSRSGFSMGNLASPGFPLIQPLYETFQEKPYFMFYHIRPTEFFTPNSTAFRRAPIQDHVVAKLQPSSMGYDLPKDEWMEHFTRSKFCLIVRGDDPKSHSLLRAVKAGCIPVLVSDAYPQYAPTFLSSVNMTDFCIFLDEMKFLQDPLRELQAIQNMTTAQIQEKLDGLRWAQRILIPDHPRSLFVPAFLRETILAQEHMRPENTLHQYAQENPVPEGFAKLLGVNKTAEKKKKEKKKIELNNNKKEHTKMM